MTFLPSPKRRTFRTLGFMICDPSVTWPSPMITTVLSFRTHSTVVACMSSGAFNECTDLVELDKEKKHIHKHREHGSDQSQTQKRPASHVYMLQESILL